MNHIHDDPEFDVLLRIVAEEFGIDVGLVEKDYWATHTLWALGKQGFDLWLKGGTSLSKRLRSHPKVFRRSGSKDRAGPYRAIATCP